MTTTAVDVPPFEGSPRWAPATRRQRWWFSDALWLDQQTLGAPISFALTHWCADRGLRDEGFGQDYAVALHRDVNRAEGWPVDANHGEQAATGVQLLRERGLVAEAYRCTTVETTLAALLERGPVLTTLSWPEAYSTPAQVAGTAVARRPPGGDDAILGGHAVLLDGADLDLDIDGVVGFVRAKNSWGRGWGDRGHVLIAVEDLGPLFGEAFVLFPAVDALRPGVDPEVAIEGDPPAVDAGPTPGEGGAVRYGEQAIGSDRWTTRDTIGYAAHAEAIARALCHPETAPPLTIGIKGPWGSGKTSLMRMVRERLEWPTGRPPGTPPDACRPVHLTTPVGGPVTNGTLLRRLRDADPPEQHTAEPEVDQAHAGEDERRWRPTVWFNPWMHQTGEQVWAGLVHEIITQVTGRMSVAEREHFWLRLNLSRIDEQAVRRRVYALVAGRLVPWLLGAVGAVVVGAVLLAGPGLAWAGTVLAAGGPVAAALAGVAATRGVLAERARGVLGRAVTPGDLAGLVRVPDYAQGAGPLLSIRTDLERVLDLVATPARPLVVFVDDLDRCNPGTVVQVIEAVNLFVAGEHPNTVFVVAMEPEVVAAHVESAYGDLVTRLSTSSGPGEQTFDFGWRFLEKVVQLPLTLPTVAPERTRAYVASLFGPAQADAPGDGARAPDEVAVRVAEQHLGGTSSVDEALARVGPGAVGADGVGAAALREAARRVVERRLATDSPEVQAVVAFAAGHLEGNPRQVKRFVNVFRFFVMISAERRLRGLRGAVPLEALAKMALLLVRWPGLVEQLVAEPAAGNGPTLLAVLEECAGPEEARAVLDAEGLPDPVVRALLGDQLEQLLGSRPRVGRLTDGLL